MSNNEEHTESNQNTEVTASQEAESAVLDSPLDSSQERTEDPSTETSSPAPVTAEEPSDAEGKSPTAPSQAQPNQSEPGQSESSNRESTQLQEDVERGYRHRPSVPRYGEKSDRSGYAGKGEERGYKKRRGSYSRFRRMEHIDHTNLVIDYKRPDILQNFLSERGKILPKSFTRISTKKQRQLSLAVKRARILGLLPFK